MTHHHRPVSPIFSIDVSAGPSSGSEPEVDTDDIVIDLLRELVNGQQKQNELLEQLTQQTAAMQKQRMNELQQWKDANPLLAKHCHRAAETLSRVQTQFLENLTVEVLDNAEHLVDGEFMLNEFVDRYGPRMAHLNGVLQVLAQLGSGQTAGDTP
ncbi:MAG: hypothetical protein R3C05_19295 [Pirellulaceae bacterium]